MKTEIKYIELKSGYSHNGPAWIGLVAFSKTGKTIYFNGKAFKRIGSDRLRGNHYDIETHEEYWISGVKKDMTDRHRFGNGKIYVEKRILDKYLKIIDQTQLDSSKYEVRTVIEEYPIEKTNEIENAIFEHDEIDENIRFKQSNEMTDKELAYFIDYYQDSSINSAYLKNRKFARNKLQELEKEQEKRQK